MTKKIKLDKLVTKFKNEESAIVNVVKEEIEPLFLGTTFLLWEAISKEDGTGTVDAQVCRYSRTQNPGRILRVQQYSKGTFTVRAGFCPEALPQVRLCIQRRA